ncbi:MAG TPA: ribosome silencing factor [bacterium]|nr:ribosome silencing factor [bacterium]
MTVNKRTARMLAQEAFEKMAFDIELIDVGRKCDYTNYFLMMCGKNTIHLDALKNLMLDFASKHEIEIYGRDGIPESGWMIFDFGDIVVHVFLAETRGFYDLMSMWGDAKRVELELKPPEPKIIKKTDK